MQALIGLGSNLDHPSQRLISALRALQHLPGITLRQHSRLYTSAPVGPQDQPDYINAVASFTVTLGAEVLLDALQAIENAHGRTRSGGRWTARTLDLDILLYGSQEINTDRLKVPHPWMKQREFVIHPLYEIAPDLSLPDGSLLVDCLELVAADSLEVVSAKIKGP